MKNPLDDYSNTRILRRCGQLGIPSEKFTQSEYFISSKRKKPKSYIAYMDGVNNTVGWGQGKRPLQDKDIVPFSKEDLLRLFGAENISAENIGIEDIQELVIQGESKKLEFKATLRWHKDLNKFHQDIETAVLKTIAALLNTEGGTLLVGVMDDGTITGIEPDRFANDDKCLLHLTNLINSRIGAENTGQIDCKLIRVGDKKVLRIECKCSDTAVFLKTNDNEEFYVRMGPSSVKLQARKLLEYTAKRFK
jgi:hypothetical protein